jgi:protein TonB
MPYLQQRHQRLPFLGAVAALHAAVLYALLNGLGSLQVPREPPPTIMRVLRADTSPPVPPALPAPDIPAPPDMALPRLMVPVVPASPTPVAEAAPRTPNPAAAAVTPGKPSSAAPPSTGAFSALHIIGGDPAPAYPDSYTGTDRAGRVMVDCVIQPNGVPTDCRIVDAQGGAAFANETLRWLNGPHHPVYRPAMRDGQTQREEHQWVVSFQPQD